MMNYNNNSNIDHCVDGLLFPNNITRTSASASAPLLYPVELPCTTTAASPISDHELSTNSRINHLEEASFNIPLPPKPACSFFSRKRPALDIDLVESSLLQQDLQSSSVSKKLNSCEMSANYSESEMMRTISALLVDDGYPDEVFANLPDQVLIHGSNLHVEQMLIGGDILQDLINGNYAPSIAETGAANDCSDLEQVDLEQVLDILLEKAQMDSARSVSPMNISLLNGTFGINWNHELINDFNDKEFEVPVNSNQVVLGGDPSNYLEVGTQMEGAGEVIGASWQHEGGPETMASWQHEGGPETRASWQHEGGPQTRASWQQREGQARASWQQKQGEIRARWQLPSDQERCSGEGAPSSQQGVGPNNSINTTNCSANSFKRSSKAAVWTGPTLMDIELALAKSGSAGNDSSTAPCTLGEVLQAEKSSSLDVQELLTDEVAMLCKEELEQSHKLNDSWRLRLKKRNHLEPKYTVKVRSEEDAASDGYRWRKYGQKSIKNSPFPRCYYRCSSGNCFVKKQVERCNDYARPFLVTYEGFHLHNRPNSFHKSSVLVEHGNEKKTNPLLHTCSPPSPMRACASSLPTYNPSPSNITILSQWPSSLAPNSEILHAPQKSSLSPSKNVETS